jgi:hypothetical protein
VFVKDVCNFCFLFLLSKTKYKTKGCSQLSFLFVSRQEGCLQGRVLLFEFNRKTTCGRHETMLATFTSLCLTYIRGKTLGEDMKETCNFHFFWLEEMKLEENM